MLAIDIEHYLTDLGQELQHLNIQSPIRVLVVGSAFLLLQGFSRPATQDIDVLFKDIDDPDNSSLYQTIRSPERPSRYRGSLSKSRYSHTRASAATG